MKPQILPIDGGSRAAEGRRRDRVMNMLHELPVKAQQAIKDSLDPEDRRRYGVDGGNGGDGEQVNLGHRLGGRHDLRPDEGAGTPPQTGSSTQRFRPA
jgi:hypothetical protein